MVVLWRLRLGMRNVVHLRINRLRPRSAGTPRGLSISIVYTRKTLEIRIDSYLQQQLRLLPARSVLPRGADGAFPGDRGRQIRKPAGERSGLLAGTLLATELAAGAVKDSG